ncbi:MAG: hypothetical protein LJE97_01545 [Betaproteobacteria bacterium]|jgi:hypothetical protein|nr:hypothetical protein [Betaproteobacteria bacterium]
MKLARIALAWSLLGLAATPALAQHVYKYRMPDGTTLYTDSQSGFTDQYIKGKLEETLAEPAPAPTEVDAAMRARREARAMNASDAAKAQASGADSAYGMLVAARQALQNAEQALQAGLEPLPGERLGIVDGHTRLSPAYWARVRKLREDVEAARDRVDRATSAWVQAR